MCKTDKEAFNGCKKCGQLGVFKVFNNKTKKIEAICAFCPKEKKNHEVIRWK